MPDLHGRVLSDAEIIDLVAEQWARGLSKREAWCEVFDPSRELPTQIAKDRTARYFDKVPERRALLAERRDHFKAQAKTKRTHEEEIRTLVGQLEEVVDRGLQAVPVLDRQGNPVLENGTHTCECGAESPVERAVWSHDGPVVVRAIHEIGLLRSLIIRKSESTRKDENVKSESEIRRAVAALREELGLVPGRRTGAAPGDSPKTH